MSLFDRLRRGEPARPRDTRARLDPAMRDVLEAWRSLGGKPLETLSAREARRQPTLARAVADLVLERTGERPAAQGVVTRDFSMPGPWEETIRARLYGPEQVEDSPGSLPVAVYWHGGGWVVGDLDSYDATPRALARLTECIVVSCRYRQAPEHPFPGAHEDALAAYRWVAANADAFGGDPARIAVAGEGAGGALACNVSLSARDLELKPPVHQLLIYPIASTNLHTESYREHGEAQPVGRATMEWSFRQLLNEPADLEDERLNLVDANLRFLPPSTVICAEIDPLRSEGERLAEELERVGVPVTQKTFTGVTHDFFAAGLVAPAAESAWRLAAQELKRAFGSAVLPT